MLTSLQFFVFFLVINFGAMLVYLLIAPGIDYVLYVLSASCIMIFAAVRLVEHLISQREEIIDLTADSNADVVLQNAATQQQFTVVIPAYLPAEKDIILDTLNYFLSLQLPIQIFLAYNTPHDLPVEKTLYSLPINVFKVPKSNSKAENINYILPHIKTKYVAIFDADHVPLKDNFIRALYWLKNGYDIVQGTCLPLTNSFLGQFLSIEFNQMYNINHLARPRLWGFAIFGGSNGYFKTETLKKFGFDSNILTEDIDFSIRALLSHVKIQFDRRIISYEQAPKNIQELWKQRSRWAQGWLQVCCKYTPHILQADPDKMSYRKRIGMLLLLPIREWGQFICIQTLPLALALSIQGHNWNWGNIWLFTFIILLVLLMIEPLWVSFVKSPKSSTCTWFFIYAFLSPFYLLFLRLVLFHAYLKEIRGDRYFQVTIKYT